MAILSVKITGLFKRCYLCLFFVIEISSCYAPKTNRYTDNTTDNINPVDTFLIKVFKNDTTTDKLKYTGYGYNIYFDKNLYIHQPYIPSVQGNNGFKTGAKAKAAGEFVVSKLKKHIVPPSISPFELDSLGLLR